MTDKFRVLVVEDSRLRHEIIARFAFDGYKVFDAADVTTAQAVFRSASPDLVVTDYLLTGELDGIDLTRFLRQQGFSGPVILYTISPSELDIMVAKDAGVSRTVDKRRGINYLSQVVAKLLAEVGKI